MTVLNDSLVVENRLILGVNVFQQNLISVNDSQSADTHLPLILGDEVFCVLLDDIHHALVASVSLDDVNRPLRVLDRVGIRTLKT